MNSFKNTTTSKLSFFLTGALVPLAVGCAGAQQSPAQLATGANCGELGDASQLVGHLYEEGVVYDAHPIEERVFRARALQPMETMGASLYVKAQPGMTSPYLERVMSCHAASGQAAHPNDPLFPQSGHIAGLEVREAKHGFAVDVRASEPAVGREIWQRAESLTQPSGTVEVQQVSLAPTVKSTL